MVDYIGEPHSPIRYLYSLHFTDGETEAVPLSRHCLDERVDGWTKTNETCSCLARRALLLERERPHREKDT